MPPRTVPGGIVTGDDFVDREDLLERIWSYLPRQSVDLLVPRRWGKTSVMKRLDVDLADESSPSWNASVTKLLDAAQPNSGGTVLVIDELPMTLETCWNKLDPSRRPLVRR
ncbi:MAG: hypothetical protein HY329_26710 [Chloroflexi bacterium]|nr:hypothetical protein [Chloroflexota bacterium]